MRLVSGLRQQEADKIAVAVAQHGPFPSVHTLWRASGVRVATLRTLAMADAFNSMGMQRQEALWAVGRLRDDALPMFDALDADEPAATLPQAALVTRVIHDYSATGLSLKAHPLSFARSRLTARGITPAGQLADERLWPHGRRIAVAGLALVRQRPATASGILFMTIEDETGVANLIVRPPIYERYRRAIRHSTAVVAWGKIERQGQLVHILVDRACNLSDMVHADPPKLLARNFH